MGIKFLSLQAEPQITLKHFEKKPPARIEQVAVNRGEPAQGVFEETALRADMLHAYGNFQLVVIAVVAGLRRERRVEVKVGFEMAFENIIESARLGGCARLQQSREREIRDRTTGNGGAQNHPAKRPSDDDFPALDHGRIESEPDHGIRHSMQPRKNRQAADTQRATGGTRMLDFVETNPLFSVAV